MKLSGVMLSTKLVICNSNSHIRPPRYASSGMVNILRRMRESTSLRCCSAKCFWIASMSHTTAKHPPNSELALLRSTPSTVASSRSFFSLSLKVLYSSWMLAWFAQPRAAAFSGCRP